MVALVKQSTTNLPLFFFLVLTSDHISPATGLSPTVTISKNGAAFASPSGAVSEIANGWYQVAGNATDTGTLGPILLHASVATADNCDMIAAQVVAFDPTSTGLGLSNVSSNVVQWNGTNVSAPATAGIPDVNAKNINNVSTSSVTTINANQGTTQPVNYTGSGASALVKTDVTDIATVAVATGTAQLGVNVVNIAGSAATLDANNLLKVDVEDINGNATAAQNVSKANQAICRGTCTTGGSATSVPTSAFTPSNSGNVSGQFIGRTIVFDINTTTTALQGQATNITANTGGATPTFTVGALTNIPASGDTFGVY